MALPIPGPLGNNRYMPTAFRFAVGFLIGGAAPNPVDTMFQSVSGLDFSVPTRRLYSGGQDSAQRSRPDGVLHSNLVLERGILIGSPLAIQAMLAIEHDDFLPSTVLVSLLSEETIPLVNWMFLKAFPVRWSFGDLDAGANTLMIEAIELTYEKLRVIRV